MKIRKIAYYTPQLDVRGSCTALYDYAYYMRSLYGIQAVIVTLTSGNHDDLAIVKFANEFEVYFTDKDNLDPVITATQSDFLYIIKYGRNDGIASKIVPTGVHCVFDLSEPHGDVYVAVSRTLAMKYAGLGDAVPRGYVEHMISLQPNPGLGDMRHKLGIPLDAIVIGRHGGTDTFDLEFAHRVIRDVVSKSSRPLYFVLVNTPVCYEHLESCSFRAADSGSKAALDPSKAGEKLLSMNTAEPCKSTAIDVHPNIIHLDKIIDNDDKIRFINTCNAHIEAGTLGHTFGLSIGEFVVCGKPVIAYNSPTLWNRAHLDILGYTAMLYRDEGELRSILESFVPYTLTTNPYDAYTPQKICEQFYDVFVRPFEQTSIRSHDQLLRTVT
jgi:hypothetical protein